MDLDAVVHECHKWDDPPVWLSAIAGSVHDLLLEHGPEPWHRMLQAAQQAAREHLFPLPGRVLSPAEKYTALAAIHNRCLECSDPINPWAESPLPDGVWFAWQCKKVECLSDKDRGQLEVILADVKCDLGMAEPEGLPDSADRGQEDRLVPKQEYVLRRAGKGYFISGFGESGYLEYLVGMPDIARLLAQPNTPIPLSQLVGVGSADSTRSCQEVLDKQGLEAARERMREIDEELEEVKERGDHQGQEALQGEREAIEHQVKSAYGIGGRSRDMNNLNDKLRPKIQRRLNTVFKNMTDVHPPMTMIAEHLRSHIRCEYGAYCYHTDDGIPWKIEI